MVCTGGHRSSEQQRSAGERISRRFTRGVCCGLCPSTDLTSSPLRRFTAEDFRDIFTRRQKRYEGNYSTTVEISKAKVSRSYVQMGWPLAPSVMPKSPARSETDILPMDAPLPSPKAASASPCCSTGGTGQRAVGAECADVRDGPCGSACRQSSAQPCWRWSGGLMQGERQQVSKDEGATSESPGSPTWTALVWPMRWHL